MGLSIENRNKREMKQFMTTILKVRAHLFTSLLVMGLTAVQTVQAQTPYDEASTIEYINARLNSTCKLFSEKKNLRIEFYDGTELVRVDYVFPNSVDFEKGVYYSEDEKALILSCYTEAGKCMERRIIKHKTKNFYERTNLETSCSGDDCKALETAVKHLIMLYVLDDYERTQPFEEN